MHKIHVIVCACALTCHGIKYNIDCLFELSPRYAHVNKISHFILPKHASGITVCIVIFKDYIYENFQKYAYGEHFGN